MCPSLSIILRESRKSDPLNQSFFGPNSHWIFVRRRSKIEQAVSLAFARTTGVWHSYGGEDNSAESAALGPKLIEDALRAILLSDTYLEALASLIPENRKLVLHYEDFLSNSQPYIARLHGVLAPPDVSDRVDYVDATRIQRIGTIAKHRAVLDFNAWLAQNYHVVEDAILTDAHGPVTKDQVLVYQRTISALQQEVRLLKQRLNSEMSSRAQSSALAKLQSDPPETN